MPEDIKNFFTLMSLTKLYSFTWLESYFFMELISWGKNSSADATMEQAYNDAHLRALYVLADFGGSQHWLGWESTTR